MMPGCGEGTLVSRDPLRNIQTPTSRSSAVTCDALTPNVAANMTNLDMLLLKGGTNGLTEENLAELRYTILTKGIAANSEGMVRP